MEEGSILKPKSWYLSGARVPEERTLWDAGGALSTNWNVRLFGLDATSRDQSRLRGGG